MPTNLRRLLNHLPLTQGGRSTLYIKSTWHKPTPFDQWKSQPPFRPMTQPSLRSHYFGPSPWRQRLVRALFCAAAGGGLWLIVESVRGLSQL